MGFSLFRDRFQQGGKLDARHGGAVTWVKLREGRNTYGVSCLVMAGLVPAIPIIGALSPPDRDRRDEPGDDGSEEVGRPPLPALAL